MQHKDEEDEFIDSGAAKAIGNNSHQPRIINSTEISNGMDEETNIISGTDEVTKMLAEKRKKALMAKYYEEKNKSESES